LDDVLDVDARFMEPVSRRDQRAGVLLRLNDPPHASIRGGCVLDHLPRLALKLRRAPEPLLRRLFETT
jgi:hypothetical protein